MEVKNLYGSEYTVREGVNKSMKAQMIEYLRKNQIAYIK
jgi:hypothetical protein